MDFPRRYLRAELLALLANASLAMCQTPLAAPSALIEGGRDLFSQQCGFCHGRDAGGGETGPDLTRSKLVAEDVKGDKLGPVSREGRTDKGMRRSALPD